MKVKLLIPNAGPNHVNEAGKILDVSDEQGRRMIEKGKAEPVVETRKETATRAPNETRRKRK